MPMVDMTITPGALDEEAKQRLAGELSRLILELEAGPRSGFEEMPHMQALSWCFIDEQEILLGGQRHHKPVYRVVVTVPEGASGLLGPRGAQGRETLVQRVTDAVLAADASPNNPVEAHRVWVQLRQISDGHWGAFGEIVTVNDLATLGFRSEGPDERIDRLRAAATKSMATSSVGAAD